MRRPKTPKTRKNPFVNSPRVLYHGTTQKAVTRILREGLVPRAQNVEYESVHRTKTVTATFLTDSKEGAYAYATQSSPHWAILEIDPTKIPGEIEPDLDDVKPLIDTDMMVLQDRFLERGVRWVPKLGAKVPDSAYRKVEDIIDGLMQDVEDRVPFSLDLILHDGVGYLGARPYVTFSIARGVDPEVLDDALQGGYLEPVDNGQLVLVIQQYLVRGKIPPSAITGVLVPDENGMVKIRDYWRVTPDNDFETSYARREAAR